MKLAIIGTRGVPANYGGFETFAEELSSQRIEPQEVAGVMCERARGVQLQLADAAHPHRCCLSLQLRVTGPEPQQIEPLAVGGGSLLIVGWAVEGWPTATLEGAAIVGWLALVNTAIAYLIYNHALQRLTALQMNLILNLSPFVTAGLAFLLLGERLTLLQGIGLVVAIVGVAVAQRPSRAGASPPIAGT